MSDLSPHEPVSGDVVGRRPSIPVGFRPAPSDDELETNVLERWQGWGTLMSVFLALFLPLYFVFFEPARLHDAALKQREESITRGAHIFAVAEAGAHGFQAGCARCHGPAGIGGQKIPFRASATSEQVLVEPPSLNDVFKRLMVDGKMSAKDAYRFVYETIAKGRPGTPMPTWGLGYGGPMNDQQIEDVVNFLISIQQGLPASLSKDLALGPQPGSFSRLIAFAAAER